MGEVYEAIDTRLDRTVAIKVLPAEVAKDAAARARFDREARAIAALNHPNICALHDIGDADGHGFLVMERLEGETLRDRLQRGALTSEQTIEYGIALADALDAAHARGLIHRDLKPANIFITTRGVVKILDFGLAKSVQESDADVTRSVNDALTVTGTALGTVAYMSPEQLRGEPLDVRTDLFSFGLVLYEMATGERAFGGSTVVVAAAGILSQQPPAPRVLRADLSEGLERSILKALEKDRARRYQSASELRADLTDVKRGDVLAHRSLGEGGPAFAGAVPVSSDATRTTPQPSRSRFRSLVFALTLTAVAVALVNWFQRDRPPSPRSELRQEAAPAAPQISPPARAAEPLPPPQPPPATPQTPAPEPGPTRKPTTAAASPSEPVTTVKPDTTKRPDIGSRVPIDPLPSQEPGPLPSAIRGDTAPGGRGARARGGRGLGTGGATLLKMLRSATPETFDLVFAANDPDSRNLALQIRGVLMAGGWTNASTTEIAEPQAKLGIFAPRVTPGVSALTTWARRSGMEPDVRLVPSLKNPRIVIGKQLGP
jgi:serine/threonine protein kinase